MIPNSFPIFHLVLNRNLALRISPPKWFLLHSIVEWGDRWLVSFNVTKTELLSFNRHRDPLLLRVELPEGTSFHWPGLTFTRSMNWKPYIQSVAMATSMKVDSLYRAQRFLTPESIVYLYKYTIRPCMEYCSHNWGGAPRSHGLDLLDRVQKRVVSLVGSGLSACLQALSHTMGNVPLSLGISYLPNVSLLETLVIQLILLCVGPSFINQAFFLVRNPLELPH